MGKKQMDTKQVKKAKVTVNQNYKEKYGFNVPENYVFKAQKGLNEDVVRQISKMKKEPQWMLDFRLKAYKIFMRKPMPTWGGELSKIDFDQIYYYLKPTDKAERSWDDIPQEMKDTFERLGVPQAEREHLAGVKAQFDSEVVYDSLREELAEEGIVFMSTDEALKHYPDVFEEYFSKIIPPTDNKFAALNSAVWSGGSFVYIPKGVHVKRPLQAYFRINAANMGQFERTLIVADEGSYAHYVEGCFTKGHKITTINGLENIEDIKVGDLVLTAEASYKPVQKTMVREHEGSMYKIKVYGLSDETFEVTPAHPFLAARRELSKEKNREFKLEWIEAKDLDDKDYLVIPIDRENVNSQDSRTFEVEFRGKKEKIEAQLTPDFFRLVGYYLAEGSAEEKGYLRFSFNENEREYIEDVKSIVKDIFGLEKFNEFTYENRAGVELVFSSAKLARIFKEFGQSANSKSIPDWVLAESDDKLAQLVVGYFRGDGNYYKRKNKHGLKEIFRINTVSESLALDVRNIILRLGIFAFVNRRERGKEDRQDMFTVGVSGNYMVRFGELVGINVDKKMNDKNRASMFHVDENYAYLPIKVIKEVKTVHDNSVKVYNFSVEGDESYVCNSIAVHNCTAPVYSSNSLHAAVVEVIVKPGARFRYTTIQNWSGDVYNLVTKRARVEKDAVMEWVDGNLGSKLTMKYPSCYLVGENAHGEVLSIAYAGEKQHQDAGAKMLHLASNTSSTIISKSVSTNGGRTSYRGLVSVSPLAKNAKSRVECDALILDSESASDTFPTMDVKESSAQIEHEATVSKIGEEKLFYLMSRGLNEAEAMSLIVSGFIEPIVKELPLEYAVELNRLIELEMEGSVG